MRRGRQRDKTKKEINAKFLSNNLNVRDSLKNLGADRTIIGMWILKKWR
jgi:hypothetical protein